MGFKDLISFNQALVAKKGWRVISNPNSLMTRIVKTKYYMNGS